MKKTAFTLAEILITLGIIGVVASLTIPILLTAQQERSTVSALETSYSIIQNAYTIAANENGTPESWGLVGSKDKRLIETLLPYLKISKNCIGIANCNPVIDVKQLNNVIDVNYKNFYNVLPSVTLANGSILSAVWVHSLTCVAQKGNSPALKNVCGSIAVDINGLKGPNQTGVDVFDFWLTKYGIIPVGSALETVVNFNSYCRDKDTQTGDGCAAWVLYNENLDYLKCSTLGWNGNTTCN